MHPIDTEVLEDDLGHDDAPIYDPISVYTALLNADSLTDLDNEDGEEIPIVKSAFTARAKGSEAKREFIECQDKRGYVFLPF